MKTFTLTLFFCCSLSNASSQKSKSHHYGWLLLIGERSICFQQKSKNVPLASNFFECSKHKIGQVYFMSVLDQDEFKNYGKKYRVKTVHGDDTVYIIPITFDRVVNGDAKRLFKGATKDISTNIVKEELFYKRNKYFIEYKRFDSSHIINLSPYRPKDIKM